MPVFASDYTAVEATTLVSNTNGEVVDGQVCCIAADSTSKGNGECLVSTGAQRGNRYRDVTNQRDRFEDHVSGETHVVIYSNSTPGAPGDGGMDMDINITNGVETCASFCPLLPGEGLDGLALDPNATDLGAVTWQGQPAEQYQWIEYDKVPIVGKVKMATVDFYTDNKGPSPIPLFSLTHVTPYNGAETGTQNVSYTAFVAGAPPAAKFQIAGMAACPQSKTCQIESYQNMRLAVSRVHG